MRLNKELEKELEARLKTISSEQSSDPAFTNLPKSDALILAALFFGSILIFLLS